MPRVKRGNVRTKKRRKVLQQTKGFKGGQKNKTKLARQALLKKFTYQYRDRKVKKRTMRGLWNLKINAAARANDTKYSELIASLKKANIELDRKVLADIAEHNPEVFTAIVEATKK